MSAFSSFSLSLPFIFLCNNDAGKSPKLLFEILFFSSSNSISGVEKLHLEKIVSLRSILARYFGQWHGFRQQSTCNNVKTPVAGEEESINLPILLPFLFCVFLKSILLWKESGIWKDEGKDGIIDILTRVERVTGPLSVKELTVRSKPGQKSFAWSPSLLL